ncbi:hypothetical protein [Streptomyces sp. NPDC005890]|uniref:hypothetical protein n=1 Tax=Streptomyces sp. NPDC005890 TaxID=3154568 RepID=UPI0033CBB8EB
MELVWREQGSEENKAALAQVHAHGSQLARLIGEFGALLLADCITAVPDEYADCVSAYAPRQLVTVTSRYLKRWCLADGDGAQTAFIAAGFLIECMQEVDTVYQFLVDIRGDAGARYGAAAACAERKAGAAPGDGDFSFRGCAVSGRRR